MAALAARQGEQRARRALAERPARMAVPGKRVMAALQETRAAARQGARPGMPERAVRGAAPPEAEGTPVLPVEWQVLVAERRARLADLQVLVAERRARPVERQARVAEQPAQVAPDIRVGRVPDIVRNCPWLAQTDAASTAATVYLDVDGPVLGALYDR